MENEKLDIYSKILLATQSINYMAHQANTIRLQTNVLYSATKGKGSEIGVPDSSLESIGNVAKEQLIILESTLNDLKNIMNYLGDTSEAGTQPIDVKITEPAFLIVVHGKDDIDCGNYDDN